MVSGTKRDKYALSQMNVVNVQLHVPVITILAQTDEN